MAGVSARRPDVYPFVPSPRNFHSCSHNLEMGFGGWRKGNTDGDRQETDGGTISDRTESAPGVANAYNTFSLQEG